MFRRSEQKRYRTTSRRKSKAAYYARLTDSRQMVFFQAASRPDLSQARWITIERSLRPNTAEIESYNWTECDPNRFFSARKGRHNGRLASNLGNLFHFLFLSFLRFFHPPSSMLDCAVCCDLMGGDSPPRKRVQFSFLHFMLHSRCRGIDWVEPCKWCCSSQEGCIKLPELRTVLFSIWRLQFVHNCDAWKLTMPFDPEFIS